MSKIEILSGVGRRDVIKRLAATAGFAAAPTVFVRNAWAQGKTIQVGIWGGPQGEFIRKNVLPGFERDFGCKVLAEEGTTLGQISRLRATKDAPKYTVMFVDDLGVEIAKREGLIDPLPRDKMPNLGKVYPRFIYEDGYGVALAVSTAGLFFNPAATKAPQSYADIWDPRFRKRLSLVSTKNTPSVFVVIATAALVTGKPFQEAQYLADQAWPKLQELKPNILNLYESNNAAVFVAQGEGDIGGIEYSKYVYPYTRQGASIDMAFPKEGAFAGVNCQVLVKGGPNQDLGAEFMNRMLDPRVQQPLAEFAIAAPPIDGLEFKPDTAKLLAYPLAKMDEMRLFSPDWAYVNKVRANWIEKLNGIFVA
jgi:putative spermidine/putrescine transport system substrate-binding protein